MCEARGPAKTFAIQDSLSTVILCLTRVFRKLMQVVMRVQTAVVR